MPELPEVEITARLLQAATKGAQVESALAPGINALRSFDPPLSALAGRQLQSIRRVGKLFLIEFEPELTALVHLMSAGRLQLFDSRASLRDRTSRLLIRLEVDHDVAAYGHDPLAALGPECGHCNRCPRSPIEAGDDRAGDLERVDEGDGILGQRRLLTVAKGSL